MNKGYVKGGREGCSETMQTRVALLQKQTTEFVTIHFRHLSPPPPRDGQSGKEVRYCVNTWGLEVYGPKAAVQMSHIQPGFRRVFSPPRFQTS